MAAVLPVDEVGISYEGAHHRVFTFPTGWNNGDTWAVDTTHFIRLAVENTANSALTSRASITNATTVTLGGATAGTAMRVHAWRKSKN